MSPDAPPPALRWLGPGLIAAGAAALGALALVPAGARGVAGGWLIASGVAPERLLALAGLGAALALSGPRLALAGGAFWAAGVAAGYVWWVPILALIQGVPGAVSHHYLTLPLSFFAAGLALVFGPRLRPALILPASLLAGVAHALSVRLSDPSPSGALGVPAAGAVIGAGLIAAVALGLIAWRQGWFEIAGRILGSWLVTIGLLYAGTAMMPPRAALPGAPVPAATPGGVPPASALPEFGLPPGDGAPPLQPGQPPVPKLPEHAPWGSEP